MKCQLNFLWQEGVGRGEWEGEASCWRELRGEVSLAERVEPYLEGQHQMDPHEFYHCRNRTRPVLLLETLQWLHLCH